MKEFRIFFVVFIAGLFCFTACQQVTEKYYVGCSYTVSFDANGGTGKMKSQTFEQGKPQNLLKNSLKNCNIKLHYFLNFFSKPVD